MTMQTYVFCEYLSENEKFHEIVLKFLKYFSSSIELTQAPDKPYTVKRFAYFSLVRIFIEEYVGILC